jgi:hypothetical protein
MERGRKSAGLRFYFRAEDAKIIAPPSFFPTIIIVVVVRGGHAENNIQ